MSATRRPRARSSKSTQGADPGRIRKRREFQEIQADARKIVSPHFVFLLRAHAASEPALGARLGVTASRKIGNAVVRNRAKRLIREAFRKTRAAWPPDIDVVVVARRPLTGLKLADLVSEWGQLDELVQKRAAQSRLDRARLGGLSLGLPN